jgi:hypothetical protein
MKLAGGSPSFASELNVDAFLEQVRFSKGHVLEDHGLARCIELRYTLSAAAGCGCVPGAGEEDIDHRH